MRTPSVVIMLFTAMVANGQSTELALRNGEQAQQALMRSHRVLEAYLKRLDPVTGLLPRRAGEDAWYVRDSAADLYPFLVMAAYFTNRDVYEIQMHEILRNEIRWSTRVGSLSDDVLPGGKGFERAEIDMDQIIFGSCEYVKDGLLPLTELLGHHAWYERMISLVDDIIENASNETPFGSVPSRSAEVNGEFLQALARLAFYTHDPRYVDMGLAITRFYFQKVIPRSNGLPAHLWDFTEAKPASDRFLLSDHGNEIVAGLSEFVLFLKESGHPAFRECKQPLIDLVNLLLDVALNEDGVWYTSIAIADHAPVDARHAHCWGYLFNGVYTAYLITGETRFLKATERALNAVTEKPTYLDDPEGSGRNYKSNAYSDALESYIVFLNRFPDDAKLAVLDTCVERFLVRQRDDGIIEDWYGDGNYVRTALMYAFMKSQGAWLEPWRSDVRLGGVASDKGVVLALQSEQPWEGRVQFDTPRHRRHFNLPVNYTRLNEWPEWFAVELDRLYSVHVDAMEYVRTGAELVQGLRLEVQPGDPLTVRVMPLEGPPYDTPKIPSSES